MGYHGGVTETSRSLAVQGVAVAFSQNWLRMLLASRRRADASQEPKEFFERRGRLIAGLSQSNRPTQAAGVYIPVRIADMIAEHDGISLQTCQIGRFVLRLRPRTTYDPLIIS
jgi:hypothetical protein